VQAVRHRHGFTVTESGPTAPLSRGRAVRQGFAVGVSNPKAFMIFAAVLPQFIDRGEGHVQTQMLLLGLLAFVIGLGSDSVWALLASRLRTWFNASPRRGEAMGAVGGVSMIGLGVGIALTGRPE
jgi:threonine/homoserine/homoserine lactone efflux protein